MFSWIKRHKFVSIMIVCLIILILFYITHPTYYKYSDNWIIGKTIEEVEKRYGKFDIITDNYVAYYIYTDNTGFLPDHLKHYYYMKYKNNIIYEVYEACQPGG